MQRQMVEEGGGERSAQDRPGLLESEGDQQFAQSGVRGEMQERCGEEAELMGGSWSSPPSCA